MLRNLLIIGCLLTTQVSLAQTLKEKKPLVDTSNPQEIGALLPPFLITTMPKTIVEYKKKKLKNAEDSSAKTIKKGPVHYITNKDVKYEGNLFVMFFNPTCGHCEDMTELLEKHIQYFKKTKVLMVAAPITRPYMDMFVNGYHTNEYSTLMVGTDSLNLIGKMFTYKGLPQINIYDKDRRLLKVFSGDTPLDSLKPYIQ